jgi:CO dehydrogenase maturation factor
MHATVRSILTAQPLSKQTVTITDMEAGVEVLSRGTPRASDVLLIIAEPYFKSLETAARVKKMASDLAIPNVYVVANKVRSASDAKAIETFCANQGLSIIATIPHDDAFLDASMKPASPIDHAPQAAGVQAVVGLAKTIVARHM